ncbi:uncharacterized protein PITG_03280 [Phytophthora infestans T30-4]|uniref:Fibronectin type-III domain-containing protein n=1 Tax=Phytophthora infestans (strain T30-4) TaxID=403677 RepID=D0MZU3_PHYIT|nr:uncharacterized protein PITG_03280 [Phytophthora infestans T30-4]EEY65756.1 hypothetical protein PITG_03280 [Phytophthora infestans T30-4]|eukprot:XP_002906355.1 hypothetical protein PITG_03280 [Phytophthora infestans T30-4]
MYTVQARAFNLIGMGPWSTRISVTTDPVSPGVINFEEGAVDIREDAGSVTLTLIRSMGGFMPATCTFSTIDGTAIAGDHYVQSSGQVHFIRGTNLQQITIPIKNNDVIDDPDKYFSVSIEEYNGESGAIGDISAVNVTITDDGDAGVVAFEKEHYIVSEAVSTLSVTIVRSRQFSGNGTFVIIPVFSGDGAVEGVDYKIPNTSVAFSDQETQVSCNITIINDLTYQERKLLKLKLDVSQIPCLSGTSELSDVFVATTTFLTFPDEAPNLVAVSRTGGSVTLSWTQPVDFGGTDITAYDVAFFLG